jgi:hypothetical protein
MTNETNKNSINYTKHGIDDSIVQFLQTRDKSAF